MYKCQHITGKSKNTSSVSSSTPTRSPSQVNVALKTANNERNAIQLTAITPTILTLDVAPLVAASIILTSFLKRNAVMNI